MWVLDATPLVYLATVDRLSLLPHLDGPRLVPERVYHEVVTRGLEEGCPDARRVEQGTEAGLLEVVTVEGIGTRGTAYLLLLLVKRVAITAEVARETLDGMLDAGWYCSPDLYATLVGTLEELSEERRHGCRGTADLGGR